MATREEIEQQVWQYLRGKGLPEVSVAGAMGNIDAESDFDPNQIEAGNSIGFGLVQWSFERRTKLERYGTDIQHQVNFLYAELTGEIGDTGASKEWINKSGHKTLDDFIKGNGTPSELADAFCWGFERPAVATAHLERRQSSAEKYFQKFTGTAGASVGDATSSNSVDMFTIESTNYAIVEGSEQWGDTLFGRRYRIIISDDDGNAIDVSQLRCTFNINKNIQMKPNSSEVTIYNLNPNTEKSIMSSATRITVEAGYEGSQFGLIFDGDILQTIRYKEDGTTYALVVVALDGDRAINFDIANYSILKGQTSRDIIDHIVNNADNPVTLGSISDSFNDQPLSRGKVMFGKSSDYLRQLSKSKECKFYVDNGEVNLISLEDLPEDEIFDLGPDSGLIGTPEQSDYGVNGKCLINPQIKINSLIHIDNSLVRAKKFELGTSNTVPTESNTSSPSVNVSGVRGKIIAEAKKICDDPNVEYSQPNRKQTINGITYWDCSSFVQHCYEVAGLTVRDITWNQYAEVQESGQFVSQADAKPGDMVFWGKGQACHHIAIYAGNGDCYAARGRDGKAPQDMVAYHQLYGSPEFGRPKVLIDADNGVAPSSPSATSTSASSGSDTINSGIRALDQDGIYRVISITYSGDTRGNDFYMNFGTISQVGGSIPMTYN